MKIVNNNKNSIKEDYERGKGVSKKRNPLDIRKVDYYS